MGKELERIKMLLFYIFGNLSASIPHVTNNENVVNLYY